MSQLAGPAAPTPYDGPIDHDRSADALPEVAQNEVVEVGGIALHALGQRGPVDVVVDLDHRREVAENVRGELADQERRVRGCGQLPRLPVHRSRHADDAAADGAGVLGANGPDHRPHDGREVHTSDR